MIDIFKFRNLKEVSRAVKLAEHLYSKRENLEGAVFVKNNEVQHFIREETNKVGCNFLDVALRRILDENFDKFHKYVLEGLHEAHLKIAEHGEDLLKECDEFKSWLEEQKKE